MAEVASGVAGARKPHSSDSAASRDVVDTVLGFARTLFIFDNQGLGFKPSSLGLPTSIDDAVDREMFPRFGASGMVSLGGNDHRYNAFMSYTAAASLTRYRRHAPTMAYAASKIALSRWVRRQAVTPLWAGEGIRLNALAPGAVRTPLLEAQLADPGLLILDEATSAVDPETERALADALVRLAAGRTTLSVAHRLSTAEAADLVVVFDRGRIVEIGPHADLVAAGGVYAGLYASWIGNTRAASAPAVGGPGMGPSGAGR